MTVNTVGTTGTGLKGEYFTGLDFTGLALTRTDARIDFNWGAASPGAGVPAGTFGVRWTGKVEAPATEQVVFCAGADDGIRVRINGAVVVENYYDHAFQTTCGSVALTAGQKYTIAIDYYSKGAPAAAKLEWWYPSGSYEVVPMRYLFPQ